jgi:cell division protein FtsA
MQYSQLLTAIDVGTSKVSSILVRTGGPGDVQFLAHSTVPSRGMRKGNVTDAEATEEAVRESIENIQYASGERVVSAYVGVTGAHIDFENRWRPMSWIGGHRVVTAGDMSRVQEEVAAAGIDESRTLVHAIPREYSVDGYAGIRDPEGMHSKDVKVETHVVTASTDAADNLVRSVEQAGVKVAGLVLQPLASSEALLTPEEREEGAAIIDVGAGTTDIIVFKGSVVTYSAAIPVGGYQFTNDMCITYNCSFEDAEQAKVEHACTDPYMVKANGHVMLDVIGQPAPLRLPHRELFQLMRERGHELSRLIMIKLREAGIEDSTGFKVVLTGGSANMPGLDQLMQRTLSMKVRVGVPDRPEGLPDELRSPIYSTAVGIVMWALKQRESAAALGSNGNGRSDNSNGGNVFSKFFKAVLPARA